MQTQTARLATILLCSGFFFSAAAYAGEAGSVDVQEIIRKSVVATQADWKEAPKYAYTERDVTSKKDRAAVTKTYEVTMIEGSQYNRLIAMDDKPLSKEQQQAEDAKYKTEVYKRTHESDRDHQKRIAKYRKERSQDQAMMREMARAFEFKFVAETKYNGRDAYEFEATPKAGYVPPSRDTKILTAMKGTLWVDMETFQWAKVEAQVTRPVMFYGLAKVGPGTRFEFEQAPVSGNIWLPKHFAIRVNGSALGFINEDSTDDETYSGYKPIADTLQARR